MNTLFKSALIASVVSFAAMSFSVTAEEGAAAPAAKPAKQVSCKQEAKAKGIKDKAEKKAFIKECEAKRKAAMGK